MMTRKMSSLARCSARAKAVTFTTTPKSPSPTASSLARCSVPVMARPRIKTGSKILITQHNISIPPSCAASLQARCMAIRMSLLTTATSCTVFMAEATWPRWARAITWDTASLASNLSLEPAATPTSPSTAAPLAPKHGTTPAMCSAHRKAPLSQPSPITRATTTAATSSSAIPTRPSSPSAKSRLRMPTRASTARCLAAAKTATCASRPKSRSIQTA